MRKWATDYEETGGIKKTDQKTRAAMDPRYEETGVPHDVP